MAHCKCGNPRFYGGIAGFIVGIVFSLGASWLIHYQYNRLADGDQYMERQENFVLDCLISKKDI